MDPQATWNELLQALQEGETDRIQELAKALLTWLQRGGFPPQETTGIPLGSDWNRTIATTGCEFALEQLRKNGSETSE